MRLQTRYIKMIVASAKPKFLARSSRNGSEELPCVKRNLITRKNRKRRYKSRQRAQKLFHYMVSSLRPMKRGA